jgi:hypothetical protein
MAQYYDRNGQSMELMDWVRAKNTDGYDRVALDDVDGVTVSTIWRGIGTAIFETMILGGEYDEQCWRYATEREARIGHANAVALVKGRTS